MLRFEFLGKSDFGIMSQKLFAIYRNNMTAIEPAGKIYDEDFREWSSAVQEGIRKESRKIILLYCNDALAGFFQYYTRDSELLVMEEVQIAPEYQGKKFNIFRELFGFVFSCLPPTIQTVEAYTVENNRKSQGILSHLGLRCIGKDTTGAFLHFQGKYERLAQWHKSKPVE